MDLPPFLYRTDAGDIRLTGHRLDLIDIVRCYNDGESPEMIVCRFLGLGLAHVYKVIGFYLDNQAAVDEYVRRSDEAFDRLQAAGPHLDVVKLRARLEAMRQAHDRPAGG